MPGAPGTASSPGNADAAIIAANAAFGGNWTSNNAGRQFLACSDAVDYCVKWEVTITGGLNWISSGIRSSFGGIWDAISEFFGWSAYGPDGQPMGGSAGYPGGYTGCGSLVYCVDM